MFCFCLQMKMAQIKNDSIFEGERFFFFFFFFCKNWLLVPSSHENDWNHIISVKRLWLSERLFRINKDYIVKLEERLNAIVLKQKIFRSLGGPFWKLHLIDLVVTSSGYHFDFWQWHPRKWIFRVQKIPVIEIFLKIYISFLRVN